VVLCYATVTTTFQSRWNQLHQRQCLTVSRRSADLTAAPTLSLLSVVYCQTCNLQETIRIIIITIIFVCFNKLTHATDSILRHKTSRLNDNDDKDDGVGYLLLHHHRLQLQSAAYHHLQRSPSSTERLKTCQQYCVVYSVNNFNIIIIVIL